MISNLTEKLISLRKDWKSNKTVKRFDDDSSWMNIKRNSFEGNAFLKSLKRLGLSSKGPLEGLIPNLIDYQYYLHWEIDKNLWGGSCLGIKDNCWIKDPKVLPFQKEEHKWFQENDFFEVDNIRWYDDADMTTILTPKSPSRGLKELVMFHDHVILKLKLDYIDYIQKTIEFKALGNWQFLFVAKDDFDKLLGHTQHRIKEELLIGIDYLIKKYGQDLSHYKELIH